MRPNVMETKMVASEVSEVDNGEVKMSRRRKKKVKNRDIGDGRVIVAEEKKGGTDYQIEHR